MLSRLVRAGLIRAGPTRAGRTRAGIGRVWIGRDGFRRTGLGRAGNRTEELARIDGLQRRWKGALVRASPWLAQDARRVCNEIAVRPPTPAIARLTGRCGR